MSDSPRIAFAGDRKIATRILDYLLAEGASPKALLVSEQSRATHAEELVRRCPHLGGESVLVGSDFRSPEGVRLLTSLDLDLVVSVHFPYLVPPELLTIPKVGWVNLHPGYLPWNRGWHTVSWALLEDTPVGASLHFMDEGVDTGDIVAQRRLEIGPSDTANSIYERLFELEFQVFKQAWPTLADNSYRRTPQTTTGTFHAMRDLFTPEVQLIDLAERLPMQTLLKKLRALTTSRLEEAAYFEVGPKRYRVRVEITEEPIEG